MNISNPASQGYHAAREMSASLQWLTRIGFVAKGIVYILIGALALMTAFGEGGETTDQQGALRRIAAQPFGEIALWVIGLGLLAYALWRFVSSISGSEARESGAKGKAERVGQFFSGIAHAALGLSALGFRSSSGGGTESMTARLMQAPGGVLLVVLAGVVLIGAGVAQIHLGWSEKFQDRLVTREPWLIRLGKWGYIARGVVFGVIGTLMMFAGLASDASQAKGFDGSLDTLAQQPFGQFLLAFVAAGLVCYGAYSIAEARYRTIRH